LTLRSAAIVFFAVAAWAAQQPTQQPAQSTAGSTASDAAAKATERKKRFEEQKKRLEEERPSSPIGAETEVSADQTLFVSPSVTNMLDGDKMPDGTIKWSVPNYPGYASKQIVQAVPTDRGPDIYAVEENAQGKSLVRAWTSEGILLWMRKFDSRIVGAVPH
jgi:hypothetical protein